MADFNDPNKLGDGQTRVERLGNLIAIFENPALDFSGNRAEHDYILGDAYEYLMRHFASESGKSKGQFYTPSEVKTLPDAVPSELIKGLTAHPTTLVSLASAGEQPAGNAYHSFGFDQGQRGQRAGGTLFYPKALPRPEFI